MTNRYSSLDFYRILVAIENRLRDLPCQGRHADGAKAYRDLHDLVRTEKEACCIRVAKAKAEQSRKARHTNRGDASA